MGLEEGREMVLGKSVDTLPFRVELAEYWSWTTCMVGLGYRKQVSYAEPHWKRKDRLSFGAEDLNWLWDEKRPW